jgi:hypothetical protein
MGGVEPLASDPAGVPWLPGPFRALTKRSGAAVDTAGPVPRRSRPFALPRHVPGAMAVQAP